jgi:hypothetical protein
MYGEYYGTEETAGTVREVQEECKGSFLSRKITQGNSNGIRRFE